MTLKNAKRRFAEIGYEVERVPVGPYRFKARQIGTLRWVQHDCIVALLIAVGGKL